jgi:TonB-dependent starch-binding outer membrane protein SusC
MQPDSACRLIQFSRRNLKLLTMKLKIIFSIIFLVFFSGFSLCQKSNKKITITGTIVDAQQKPIEGAVIFIDKVKTNSVTDKNGFFKVKASPSAEELLVFSFFNGTGKTSIKGRTTINMSLTKESGESKVSNTDEDEVVNVGYGTMKKKDMTTQVGVINGQDPKFVGARDIYDLIRGQLPGVEVMGNTIKIMGASSLNLSTTPLFVVDGVIVQNFDDINPRIVKSVEVLKGAAASVYGTKGSNGVILITTLTGKDKR